MYYISFISQNRNDLNKLTSYFDEYNHNNIDLYIFFGYKITTTNKMYKINLFIYMYLHL